jgi:RNA polymerase sigma factor (sigma-70 family)
VFKRKKADAPTDYREVIVGGKGMPGNDVNDRPAKPWCRVLRHLRRAALARQGGCLSDGELLACYVARRDEAAFEALVRRHGPMVLGVCRRVIGNAHDAEDAFQATFLVLVRKAASIGKRDAVGNWLFGVAYRAALKARSVARRRQAREKQVEDMPERWIEPEDLWHDLRPLLDAELLRLPDKYRAAILLCDLEGRSRRDAAQLLGLPEGTLSSRLAAGRKMLAARLARRGLALSGAAVGAVLAQGVATAALPAPLVIATAKAATLTTANAAVAGGFSAKVLSLTEGVLKAMWMTKVKLVTAVLLAVGAVGVGTGVAERYASTGGRAADEVAAAPAPAPESKNVDEKKEPAPKEGISVTSPDGTRVATAKESAVTLVEASTGKTIWVTKSHTDTVTALTFTPDGKIICSAGKDGTIRMCDVASGKEILCIKHKAGYVLTVSISPDGKILFAATDDGKLQRWDVRTGKSLD